MKVRMTAHYSDLSSDPQTGDVLAVVQEVFEEGYLDHYLCEWQGKVLEVYTYECEEVQ